MSEIKYSVNEIFSSIDGEGKRAGELTTFIRLNGCNIRCSYCDTAYALKAQPANMTLDEIYDEVSKCPSKNLTITGGEPLIQKFISEMLAFFACNDYYVNVETNGAVEIPDFLCTNKVFFTMDWKVPSSGANKFMLSQNLGKLRSSDVLKIVMSDKDEDYVFGFLKRNYDYIKAPIYLSPIFGKIELSELVDFQKKLALEKIFTKVQIQMHKVIWSPDERGV